RRSVFRGRRGNVRSRDPIGRRPLSITCMSARLVQLSALVTLWLTACDRAPNGGADPDASGGGGSGGGGAVACEPACGGDEVCLDGTCASAITGVPGIDDVLLGDPAPFDTQVLISQDPDLSWR